MLVYLFIIKVPCGGLYVVRTWLYQHSYFVFQYVVGCNDVCIRISSSIVFFWVYQLIYIPNWFIEKNCHIIKNVIGEGGFESCVSCLYLNSSLRKKNPRRASVGRDMKGWRDIVLILLRLMRYRWNIKEKDNHKNTKREWETVFGNDNEICIKQIKYN